MAPIVTPPAVRFFRNVDSSGDCHIWTGGKDKDGYGKFWDGTYDGRLANGHKRQTSAWRAHRYAWTVTYGEIPFGMQACHECDNPPCVNPAHLFLGTQTDNEADKLSKGRQSKRKGELNTMARLTFRQVRQIRKLYASGLGTQEELGEIYGVARTTISAVVNFYNWNA